MNDTEDNDPAYESINMDVAAEQIKKLNADQFTQLHALVQKQAEQRNPPDITTMSDHEFEKFKQNFLRRR